MNDSQDELEQFGQQIVRYVRDEMIEATDQALLGTRRDIYSTHLYNLALRLSPECRSFLAAFIPYVVDGTMSVFLQQFDVQAEWLQIHVRKREDGFIDLGGVTDGLEGEYSAHWSLVYSQQRADTISREAERLFDRETTA